MVIADLKTPCSSCAGSGFRAGFNQYGSLLSNDSGKCTVCQGRGFSLTKLGEDVWELYQPMILKMIQSMPTGKEISHKNEEQ
ncbi:MAG: hypothetical protein HQM13_00770 [SAR324 cluster bacterium]|nr:hypothetical protein [SAR324 cluster bacterium]